VQQRRPTVGEFGRGWTDGVGIGYLEFDAGLRNRVRAGPVGGAEARPRRLCQGPDAEVLASGDLLAVVVVVAFAMVQR
jgi:hypothetical protein